MSKPGYKHPQFSGLWRDRSVNTQGRNLGKGEFLRKPEGSPQGQDLCLLSHLHGMRHGYWKVHRSWRHKSLFGLNYLTTQFVSGTVTHFASLDGVPRVCDIPLETLLGSIICDPLAPAFLILKPLPVIDFPKLLATCYGLEVVWACPPRFHVLEIWSLSGTTEWLWCH